MFGTIAVVRSQYHNYHHNSYYNQHQHQHHHQPGTHIEPTQLFYVTLNVSRIEDHQVFTYQPI